MRDAPVMPDVWLAPKLTPDMTLMLTVARAVTLVTGWNADAPAGADGADAAGDTLAAKRITGPNIRMLIVQCAGHG